MTYDWDGKIRMDPSLAVGDGRADRAQGPTSTSRSATTPTPTATAIVTPAAGLLNPNHFLSAAIAYLFGEAPAGWGRDVGVGKTLVSLVDDRPRRRRSRAAARRGPGRVQVVRRRARRRLARVRRRGERRAPRSCAATATVWTTDKDGIIADLLACELTARTGRDPGVAYRELTERFGAPAYRRIDAPATPDQKARARQAVAVGRDRDDPRRRPDHRDPDPRPRQRRPDRRAEGRHGQRLVRGPPVGHRERRQGLRRELPRRGPSRAAARGGPGLVASVTG